MAPNGCTYCVYIVQENLQKKIHPLVSYSMQIQNQTDRWTDSIHVPQKLHLWG